MIRVKKVRNYAKGTIETGLKGVMPKCEPMLAIESERRATRTKTINDLLDRLTPEGRKAIEDFSRATTTGGGVAGGALPQ